MMSVDELFRAVRESPARYLARPSAKTLQAFLSGYELALKGSDPEFLTFSAKFSNWMRKRYKIHSSQHWTKIIEFYSLTEDEEMALFWKLLDEFERKRDPKKRSGSSVISTVAKP